MREVAEFSRKRIGVWCEFGEILEASRYVNYPRNPEHRIVKRLNFRREFCHLDSELQKDEHLFYRFKKAAGSV